MEQNITAGHLIGAATAALRQAYETDLPWVESVEVEQGAEVALSQEDRRDLYAAKRLCNIQYGALRAIRRRPALSGLKTCIVPFAGTHRIVVLSCEGPAGVYVPGEDGCSASLVRVLSSAADWTWTFGRVSTNG
jgi:hypothetical protein